MSTQDKKLGQIRQEALLNEYKGNLFEYLVTLILTKKYKLEAQFVTSLGADFRSMLSQCENFIRNNYPELLIDLPRLASGLAEQIEKTIELTSATSIHQIGKVAMASQDQRFGEADILIKDGDKQFPISIKLSKQHAYVNTKSAGLKSFFSKYFTSDAALKLQEELNQFSDMAFDDMSYKIHEEAGIEYDSAFKNWKENGLTELPGELDEVYRVHYLEYLYAVIEKLHGILVSLYQNNTKEFATSLLPLLGFSQLDVVQATCYYKAQKDGKGYGDDCTVVETSKSIVNNLDEIEVGEYKKGVANFNIYFPDRILQIRLKAMNRFTSKSFKINCSVKTNQSG